MLLPPAIAVGFYLLMIGMHFARTRAQANGWPSDSFGSGIFNPDNLRIPGVLQRIGIVYGFAGTIALFAGRQLIMLAVVLLCAIYSILMLAIPYGPEHTRGKLEFDDNLARYVDVKVFDRYTVDENGKKHYSQHHTYSVYPDNEGLLSTIPAIATTLLGILVGLSLKRETPTVERSARLLAMSVPMLIIGCLLNWWLMPINKILWTPSYVFFTAGLAMLLLGFLFWLIDVRGRKRWTLPAVILGMNAIAAYVAAAILPRLLNLIKLHHPGRGEDKPVGLYTLLHEQFALGVQQVSDWVAAHGHVVIATPKNFTLINAMFLVLVVWLVMAVMYVFKVFVKV
jgi:predicted acyltransferase